MDASRIGVIFDCDGTLLDSMDVWHEAEAELARQAGVRLSPAEQNELTTLTIPEAGAFFHNRFWLGTDADDVVRMLDELMLDYYLNRTQERPGALAFVRDLVEHGVHVSVASSSPQPYLQAGLARAGFSPYINIVLSVDDVGASKREPVVFDRARELMGTPLESTWGFEDSAYALRTLRSAGYRTAAIPSTTDARTRQELHAASDLYITTFEDLDAQKFIALNEA